MSTRSAGEGVFVEISASLRAIGFAGIAFYFVTRYALAALAYGPTRTLVTAHTAVRRVADEISAVRDDLRIRATARELRALAVANVVLASLAVAGALLRSAIADATFRRAWVPKNDRAGNG